jgi:hypothetical protein
MSRTGCGGHLEGFVHLAENVAGLEDFDLGEMWQDADLTQPRAIQEKIYWASYRKKDLPPEVDRRLGYYRTQSFFTPDDTKSMKREALRQLLGDVKQQRTGKVKI